MGTYVGERSRTGFREGKGTYDWPHNFSYTGDWRDGKMHGRGKMRVSNSTIEGQFDDGQINGLGVRTWFDGEQPSKIYRGPLSNGEMQGKGELVTRTERYTGPFISNRREGDHGTLVVVSAEIDPQSWQESTRGEKWTGTWAGNRMEGRGKYEDPEKGHAYVGDFSKGERSGRGSGTWLGGGSYEGAWLCDKRHGHGRYRCEASKVEYDGSWAEDSATGRGVAVEAAFVVAEEPEVDDKKKKKPVKDEEGYKPGDVLPTLIVLASPAHVTALEEAPLDGATEENPQKKSNEAVAESGRELRVTLVGQEEMDYFRQRPTLREVATSRTFGVGDLDEGLFAAAVPVTGKGKAGKAQPVAQVEVRGLVAFDLDEALETVWIGPKDHWHTKDEQEEEAPSAETRSFSLDGGLTLSFDFCLGTSEKSTIIETTEAGVSLTVARRDVEEASEEQSCDVLFELVVLGAVCEFQKPEFQIEEWHSVGIVLSPQGARLIVDGSELLPTTTTEREPPPADVKQPFGCRFRVGGCCFRAFRVSLSEESLPATAAIAQFYDEEREVALEEAAELSAWQKEWVVEKVERTAAGNARNAAEELKQQQAELLEEEVKEGAPPQPDCTPRGSRVRERRVVLEKGKGAVGGIQLSSRIPPGDYTLRVEDVSREGEKRWSDAEKAVFPLLKPFSLPFTVLPP